MGDNMHKEVNFVHTSIKDKVVDYLKKEIFLGKYKGGDRIVSSKIAERLNISEEPVRNAIGILENQGLINKVPRKGSFVVQFTQEDISEIFEIRVLLEDRVLEIIINEQKLTEKDYENLHKIVDEMVEIASGDYSEEYKILNVNNKDILFHRYLWEKSGSKRTVRILENLYDQLQLAMIMDAKLEGSLTISAKKHYEILKYLKLGNLNLTKKAIIEHIVTYKNQLIKKEKY